MRLSVIEHAKPCEERRCASKWILYTHRFFQVKLFPDPCMRALWRASKMGARWHEHGSPQKPTLEIKCKRNIEWNPWHHQIEIQLNLQNLSLLNHKIFKMAMSSMSSGSGYLFRITRTSWSYWNIPEIYQSFRCSHTNRNVKPVNDSNYFQFFKWSKVLPACSDLEKSMAELAHSHEGRVAISQLLIPVPKNPLCCSRTSS